MTPPSWGAKSAREPGDASRLPKCRQSKLISEFSETLETQDNPEQDATLPLRASQALSSSRISHAVQSQPLPLPPALLQPPGDSDPTRLSDSLDALINDIEHQAEGIKAQIQVFEKMEGEANPSQAQRLGFEP